MSLQSRLALLISAIGADVKAIQAQFPTVVTSLPASPTNGKEVYLKVGSGDSAGLWHCHYDTSITDVYKWRVIGRPWLRSYVETYESINSSGGTNYRNMATVGPVVAVPVTGLYEIQASAWIARVTAGTAAHIMGFEYTSAANVLSQSIDVDGAAFDTSTTSEGANVTGPSVERSLKGATNVTAKYKTTAGEFGCMARMLRVTPHRLLAT